MMHWCVRGLLYGGRGVQDGRTRSCELWSSPTGIAYERPKALPLHPAESPNGGPSFPPVSTLTIRKNCGISCCWWLWGWEE
eukprot:10162105-Alexandrium_andersonii.AAC.1